ncbi:TolC family protein [Romeria aff. gracilis LEGE 07310]|uniref:TolC family protein n=1 Tax=Vasconcelosia minhoensis LEGE 07310 TaxID=915328 RepID=A0A8J7AG31_9CYAN|nr:TolC family protein [Romeria gracilis]MBE9076873.1 TolC family protein [Romeria aff. gracilis LEGE 07310]
MRHLNSAALFLVVTGSAIALFHQPVRAAERLPEIEPRPSGADALSARVATSAVQSALPPVPEPISADPPRNRFPAAVKPTALPKQRLKSELAPSSGHPGENLAQLPVLNEPAESPASPPPSESAPTAPSEPAASDELTEPEAEPEPIASPATVPLPPGDLVADPNPLNFPTQPEEVNVADVRVITLAEAVELAYLNSQSLQVALLERARAEAAVDEAKAALYPSLDASSSVTTQESQSGGLGDLGAQLGIEEDSGSDVDTSLDGSLDLSYSVFTSGGRRASIRAAELQLRFNELEIERIQEQLRLDTATLYYNLQESTEQIRIAQDALGESERNLRDSQLRQQAGVGTRFDVLRAEVEVANDRQSLIQAQGEERTVQRNLARLLNLPPTAGVQATAVEVAESWPLTLEESIVLAFQNRAELEEQLLQRDISDQQRIVALSAVRPQVSLFANYTVQNVLTNNDTGFNDNYAFGARFNMNLFDGGAARASARQQERNSEIAEQRFSETQDQVRFEVEEAYFDLETNQENISTAQLAVISAEESLRLANLRLEAGVGTQLDVLTAQSDLTDAQVNLVQAILGYNRALAALQRAVSNLGSTL